MIQSKLFVVPSDVIALGYCLVHRSWQTMSQAAINWLKAKVLGWNLHMLSKMCDLKFSWQEPSKGEKHISHLDSLQSIWDLCNILWHVKAFGSADFSIDQPLLEISQGNAEPLLQQTLLILTLPGCSKAETAEIQMLQKINEDRNTWQFYPPVMDEEKQRMTW